MPHRCILLSYAHPDDESFSGAGVASFYGAQDVQIVLVTATRGEAGKPGNPPICAAEDLPACREQELRTAAKILGIHDLHLLPYRDRQVAEAPVDQIRSELVSLIRRYGPQIVLTFDPNGFNRHPDHIAISRFTSDAVQVAADPRWIPELGPAHHVQRLLWTPPLPPWEAARLPSFDECAGIDFVLELGAWAEQKEAALRAHRTQHQSIERCFLHQADLQRILSIEAYRQAWGPPIARRPSGDLFENIVV